MVDYILNTLCLGYSRLRHTVTNLLSSALEAYLLTSFRNTCPYHCNLFCCSVKITSSVPILSLNSLLGTLSFTLILHIQLTILISARWSATSFSFLTGQACLPIKHNWLIKPKFVQTRFRSINRINVNNIIWYTIPDVNYSNCKRIFPDIIVKVLIK